MSQHCELAWETTSSLAKLAALLWVTWPGRAEREGPQPQSTVREYRDWIEKFASQQFDASKLIRVVVKHALPTNPQAVVEQVEILRRPGQQIAIELHLSPATVSRILRRLGITVGITVTVHLI